MAIDEDALKQFIASLPNLDNEGEEDALGEEEQAYVSGVLDAYRVLRGEEPKDQGLVKTLREIAAVIRNPELPDWRGVRR